LGVEKGDDAGKKQPDNTDSVGAGSIKTERGVASKKEEEVGKQVEKIDSKSEASDTPAGPPESGSDVLEGNVAEESEGAGVEQDIPQDQQVDPAPVLGIQLDELVLGGDLRFLNLQVPSPISSDTSLASTVPLNQPDGGSPSPIPSSSSVASHSILPYLGWFFFVFFSSPIITNIFRECLSCWHTDS
jgi:hypothetical protein